MFRLLIFLLGHIQRANRPDATNPVYPFPPIVAAVLIPPKRLVTLAGVSFRAIIPCSLFGGCTGLCGVNLKRGMQIRVLLRDLRT